MLAHPLQMPVPNGWWLTAPGFPNAYNTGPRPTTPGMPAGPLPGQASGPLQPVGKLPGQVASGTGWKLVTAGSLTFVQVTGSNALLQRLYVPCNIDIEGWNNTKVQDCVVVNSTGGAGGGIKLVAAPNTLIEHCTISSAFPTGPNRLLVGIKDNAQGGQATPFWTARGNNIFHASTGIQGESGLWEYNYVHDMGFDPGPPADHINGLMTNSYGQNRYFLHIRNNTVLNNYTQADAVALFEDSGAPNGTGTNYPQANRLVEGNLLAGGSYTIYAGQNQGGVPAYNIRFLGNRVSTMFLPKGGSQGSVADWPFADPGSVWAGNVWHETGEPLLTTDPTFNGAVPMRKPVTAGGARTGGHGTKS